MALVDVLIPTYNRKTGLAIVLAGLLGQTFSDFDVIISDQSDGNGRALDSVEIQTLVRALRWHGHQVQLHRDRPRPDPDAFIRAYPLDISPATDNRPFFFNLILLGDLLDPALSGSGVYRTSMEAITILFAVIGITAALSALFVIVPLWLGGRRRGLVRPAPATLAYFGGLGLAFMLVEIPTMQKLTVYLGQPVYSLAVVLFSLLLFSGLGSWWSGRWPGHGLVARLRRVFPVLVAFLLLHALFSSLILEQTLRLGLNARLAVAVLLLSILGFLMGIPFPSGIRWAGQCEPTVVPWLWGINGVTSVLGSALATALSIHVGFRATLFIAALAYAAAGALFIVAARRAAEPEPAAPAPGLEPA